MFSHISHEGREYMSYAIIRNEKYTKEQMIQLAPHNERFKKKYSNKNIDLSKTSQNYHLKNSKPYYPDEMSNKYSSLKKASRKWILKRI